MKSKKIEITEQEILDEIDKLLLEPRKNSNRFIFSKKQIEFVNKVRFGRNPLTLEKAAEYWNKLFKENISGSALKNRILNNRHLFVK